MFCNLQWVGLAKPLAIDLPLARLNELPAAQAPGHRGGDQWFRVLVGMYAIRFYFLRIVACPRRCWGLGCRGAGDAGRQQARQKAPARCIVAEGRLELATGRRREFPAGVCTVREASGEFPAHSQARGRVRIIPC